MRPCGPLVNFWLDHWWTVLDSWVILSLGFRLRLFVSLPCSEELVLWFRTAAAQRARESQSQSQSHRSLRIHLKHRDASCVNEVLYDTSICLNSVFAFEFVKCLCIGAPPKDPAQKRFVIFWHFRETRETKKFPRQTTTSGSQLDGREINIRDPSLTPSWNSMERPLDDAAMPGTLC